MINHKSPTSLMLANRKRSQPASRSLSPITNHQSPITSNPMSLRAKLLLVALSMLILPLAGWQLLRQMESLLREGQEQALVATADALARAVASSRGGLPPGGPVLFLQALPRKPRLDGDADDWSAIERRRFEAGGSAFDFSLGRIDDSVFLLVEARVASPRPADAHWTTAATSDHFLLQIDGTLGTLGFRIANAASGPLRVTAADGGPAPLNLHGYWSQRADGFVVELQLPQGLLPERLGVQLVDAGPDQRLQRVGTAVEAHQPLWPLTLFDPRQARPIDPLLPAGMRARLLQSEGWILAESGALPDAPAGELPWWRRQLYQTLLFASDPLAADESGVQRSDRPEVWQALGGLPGIEWRRDHDAPRLLLSAAVPVRIGAEIRGAVLLEREHQTLLLTDRAFGGLLGASVLALLLAGLIAFAFASRLSWRIRRLSQASETALTQDGRVRAFPTSTAGDEIGELSRRFARLLGEIGASQEYLRSLAGKLSHELNTPIAIVRGALDNVDVAALAPPDQACIERARSGAERLSATVRAMSEASRIEQAIDAAEAEDIDLAGLLRDCAENYRPLLAPRALQLDLPSSPLTLHCAPELVVQALDKLIDNARGFAPEDGWVRISLEHADDGGARLRVANAGPRLPRTMQHRLFDSMVSLRPERRGAVHLGFGLYLVRLVAELHRGSARADDLADGEGVEFSLTLRHLPRR
jgi:two-component system, OmpR family, sensor histidine kinase ChvG